MGKIDVGVSSKEFQKAIGMSIEDAADYFKSIGYNRTRVVIKNGEGVIVTMEYRTDRVNVSIESDKVVGIVNIG